MRIHVHTKPNAMETKVEKIDDTHFIVAVTELPIQGKANRAIIRALADYLRVKPYQIELVSGATSKTKIFEINRQ